MQDALAAANGPQPAGKQLTTVQADAHDARRKGDLSAWLIVVWVAAGGGRVRDAALEASRKKWWKMLHMDDGGCVNCRRAKDGAVAKQGRARYCDTHARDLAVFAPLTKKLGGAERKRRRRSGGGAAGDPT